MKFRLQEENKGDGGGGGGGGIGDQQSKGNFDKATVAAIAPVAMFADDSLTKEPAFADFKTIDDLARSYLATKKMVGADANQFARIPTDQSTPEEVAAFRKKIGWSDNAADYAFTVPDEHKALVTPELLTSYAKFAQDNGIPVSHAKQNVEWFLKATAAADQAEEAVIQGKRNAARAELEKQWGQAFPERLHAANWAAESIAGKEFIAWAVERGVQNDAPFLIALEKMAKVLKGDKSLIGGATGGSGGDGLLLDTAQALAEVSKLMADPVFVKMLTDKHHVGHDDAVKRRENLYRMAYPEPRR